MIKSRRMRCVGHVARKGKKRNSQKRPLGRPRRRCVDNMKMDLREMGWDGMDWINLARDRDQWEGSCEHGNEPSGSIKCWEVHE
jgi:hypothetical protein